MLGDHDRHLAGHRLPPGFAQFAELADEAREPGDLGELGLRLAGPVREPEVHLEGMVPVRILVA